MDDFSSAFLVYCSIGGVFLLLEWLIRNRKETKLVDQMLRDYGRGAFIACLLIGSLFWPVFLIQTFIKCLFVLYRYFLIWQVNRLIKRLKRMQAELAETQVRLDEAKANSQRITDRQIELQKMLDELRAD